MKIGYVSPIFLDGNGTITMTASQLGKLGVDQNVVTEWEAWWAACGEEYPEDFDINKSDEMYEKYGFLLSDSDTWSYPIFGGEE